MAANLIEDAYRAFTGPVSTRLMRFEDKGWLHRRPEVIGNMTARLIDIVHDYFDWSEELVTHGEALTHAITMDFVMDNNRARAVEHRYHLRNGSSKYLLREGLHKYAQMSGHLTRRDEL